MRDFDRAQVAYAISGPEMKPLSEVQQQLAQLSAAAERLEEGR
jgi:hypothetical protein